MHFLKGHLISCTGSPQILIQLLLRPQRRGHNSAEQVGRRLSLGAALDLISSLVKRSGERRERVQLAKCLPSKPENLPHLPPIQKLEEWHKPVIPMLGEQKQEEP